MFQNLTSEVDAIEGIGPKTKSQLNTHNIHTLLDLIAESPGELHEKVDGLASEEEIRQWLNMAAFMQMDAVSGQFAEALIKGGVKSISEIALKPKAQLEEIFNNASSNRIIPEAPNSDTIFEMIREATILTFSQTYLGKLIDESGNAVANASVKVYYQQATTNSNGYFRLFGLMSSEDKLLIQTEEGVHHCFDGYPISRYADNIQVDFLELNSESEVAQEFLSEYDGHTLPPTGSYPIRTNTTKTDDLRKGDLFLVRSIKPEKNEITLQSIYNEFDGSQFTVQLFKYPMEDLNITIAERDYVRLHFGKLKKVKGDRSMVKYWKQIHRIHKDSSMTSNKTIKLIS